MGEGQERIRVCGWQAPEEVLGVQSFKSLPGKLSAALGRVDLFTAELLKLLHGHDDGVAVPVCGQQITGATRGDVDTVAPVPLTSG